MKKVRITATTGTGGVAEKSERSLESNRRETASGIEEKAQRYGGKCLEHNSGGQADGC